MNYHHFSESAFPVLVWCKMGCKQSHTELSNNIETVKFNGKTYLANAMVVVAEYRNQKRMMQHERNILKNS